MMALVESLAIALASTVLGGVTYQQVGVRRDARRHPPPGRWIDVEGVRLHAHVTGHGQPTVILEAGIAASSLSWARVQPEIAQFATVLSYDRPGLGWSGPARTCRTPRHVVAERRALLPALDLPGPYVLVGHSFGGMVSCCHAAWYPEEVAGVVLVDALHPHEWRHPLPIQRARLARGVALSRRGAILAEAGVVRLALALLMSGSRRVPQLVSKASSGQGSSVIDRLVGEVRKLPEAVWPQVRAHWCNPKSFRGMADYLQRLPESSAEAADAGPLDDLPLVVISQAGLSGERLEEQLAYVRLSTRGEHRPATKSGHWVQLDQPELVTQAVRDVISLAAVPSLQPRY